MTESIEERLQDLERLILKQSERIDALESRLALAQHLAAGRAVKALEGTRKDAA